MSFLKIAALFFSLSTAISAASVPAGCNPIKIKGEFLSLTAKKPVLILLHNISENTLWLTHPENGQGASAGWTSELKSGNWSAFALTEKNFRFNCTETRPGHEQQIACEGAIMACTLKKAKIPSEEKGTFWAAEDKSLSKLKAALQARSIKLGSVDD